MMNNEEKGNVENPDAEPAFRQSVLRNKKVLIAVFAVTAVVILAVFLFGSRAEAKKASLYRLRETQVLAKRIAPVSRPEKRR